MLFTANIKAFFWQTAERLRWSPPLLEGLAVLFLFQKWYLFIKCEQKVHLIFRSSKLFDESQCVYFQENAGSVVPALLNVCREQTLALVPIVFWSLSVLDVSPCVQFLVRVTLKDCSKSVFMEAICAVELPLLLLLLLSWPQMAQSPRQWGCILDLLEGGISGVKWESCILFLSGSIVSVGDPKKKYTRFEKIGQG